MTDAPVVESDRRGIRGWGICYGFLPPPLPGLVVADGDGLGLGATLVVEHVALNDHVRVVAGAEAALNENVRL